MAALGTKPTRVADGRDHLRARVATAQARRVRSDILFPTGRRRAFGSFAAKLRGPRLASSSVIFATDNDKRVGESPARPQIAFGGRLVGSGCRVLAQSELERGLLLGPLSMLWTAPPPARECHGSGCR